MCVYVCLCIYIYIYIYIYMLGRVGAPRRSSSLVKLLIAWFLFLCILMLLCVSLLTIIVISMTYFIRRTPTAFQFGSQVSPFRMGISGTTTRL